MIGKPWGTLAHCPQSVGDPHCTRGEQYSSALWLLSSHSLEDGGLRFTVRWGALFICLQLLDWKLRQPGKPCTISDKAEAWLFFPRVYFCMQLSVARYSYIISAMLSERLSRRLESLASPLHVEFTGNNASMRKVTSRQTIVLLKSAFEG